MLYFKSDEITQIQLDRDEEGVHTGDIREIGQLLQLLDQIIYPLLLMKYVPLDHIFKLENSVIRGRSTLVI